ncbi:hypothetical protein DB88DRAFT_484936 [Papiliotrema laurentii]|uniref:Uncharacterized protein n=1 Tax=Papiliotrema laurentii TaxID=5418 RepID=A0AAD9FTB3_PAPLA|nr:hypothetical protein DB88DRAFT_484936 [Papiliotrema laurentii]
MSHWSTLPHDPCLPSPFRSLIQLNMIGMLDQARLIVLPNWVVPLSTQILSLIALYMGADASLKRFVTIRSMSIGPETGNGEPKRIVATDTEGPTAGVDRQTRRHYVFTWIITLLSLAIFIGIQCTRSQSILDISLMIVGFIHLTFMFDTVLGILFSRTASMSLGAAGSEKSRKVVYFARHGRVFAWLHIAALLATAMLLLLQSGPTIITPILSFVWILSATTTFAGEGEINKIRRTVWISLGYIAACWVFLAATFGYIYYTTSDDVKPAVSSTPGDSGSPWGFIRKPSEWLLVSVRYHIESAAIVGPASLLCMGLRYDYLRSKPVSLVNLTPDGKASMIPRCLGSFARPTFNAGFLALAATLLASNYVAKQFCYKEYWLFQGVMVLFTHPAVTLVSAVSVWLRGQGKAWWTFEEQWGPSEAGLHEVPDIETLEERRGG